MNPLATRTRTFLAILFFCGLGLTLLSFGWRASEAQGNSVSVTAADPVSTAQGTVNLNVKVTGKGFKNGASAKWFVTGTTNPGGVTVNSTTFVNANELTANITVSDTATIANFDIAVVNGDGRGGKGTELFAVTEKGAGNALAGCTVQPLPSGISLVGSLNYVSGGTTAYGPGFGITVRARQMTLNGQSVVVVGVGTPAGTGKLEVFFVNPVNGQVLDNTVIGTGTSPQPHITVNYGNGTRSLAVGDVNADGIPDFAAGSQGTGSANAEVGSVSPSGVLSYQVYPLTFPANATGIGWGLAMGDLNNDGRDEIAAGAIGGSPNLGQVSIFSFNGSVFTNTQNIQSPLPNSKKDESFGYGVAIADVTGTGNKDLIVGAPRTTIGKATAAGRVFVFPGPLNAASYLTFTTGGKDDSFGRKVAAGNINGDFVNDFLASTDWNSAPKAQVYYGLVSSGQAPNSVLQSITGLGGGWSTTEPDIADVNGDGPGDVLIGAPNAESNPVCGGAAYLYLSNGLGSPLANRLMLSSPVLEPQGNSSFQAFGWATTFAGSGSRLFFVSDHGLDLNGAPAGQVYIFKVN